MESCILYVWRYATFVASLASQCHHHSLLIGSHISLFRCEVLHGLCDCNLSLVCSYATVVETARQFVFVCVGIFIYICVCVYVRSVCAVGSVRWKYDTLMRMPVHNNRRCSARLRVQQTTLSILSITKKTVFETFPKSLVQIIVIIIYNHGPISGPWCAGRQSYFFVKRRVYDYNGKLWFLLPG